MVLPPTHTPPPGDLTCREAVAFLADFLDGALEPGERTSFEAHLIACPECVAYLHRYGATIRLARDAETGGVDADVPAPLVDAILAARRAGAGRPPPVRRRR
jgi:anti-sigma factor RsiW